MSIDTSANNKVWITLEIHEWPSQVTDFCAITIYAKEQFSPMDEKLIQWHLRELLMSIQSIQTFV